MIRSTVVTDDRWHCLLTLGSAMDDTWKIAITKPHGFLNDPSHLLLMPWTPGLTQPWNLNCYHVGTKFTNCEKKKKKTRFKVWNNQWRSAVPRAQTVILINLRDAHILPRLIPSVTDLDSPFYDPYCLIHQLQISHQRVQQCSSSSLVNYQNIESCLQMIMKW